MTSTVGETIDTEDVWIQLRRELEDVGISGSVLEEHHTYICDWIKAAISNGMLEEMDMSSPARLKAQGSIDSGYGGSSRSIVSEPPSYVSVEVANREFENQLAQHPSRIPSEFTSPLPRSNVKVRKASSVSSVMFKLFKKDTAIIEATSDGDLPRVAKLISSGANVNSRDRWGVSSFLCNYICAS